MRDLEERKGRGDARSRYVWPHAVIIRRKTQVHIHSAKKKAKKDALVSYRRYSLAGKDLENLKKLRSRARSRKHLVRGGRRKKRIAPIKFSLDLVQKGPLRLPSAVKLLNKGEGDWEGSE